MKEIDRTEMENLLAQGALLVDVREDEELEAGAIEGHTHWPLSRLPEFEAQAPQDRSIVFYCRSGARSLRACEVAETWGVKETYSLAGGYLEYAQT